MIDRNQRAARRLGVLPPEDPQPPPVDFSTQPQIKLHQVMDLASQDEQTITVLVRVTQWLALERGFPAVHLFYDTTRLFTVHGVDVANAVQLEFFQHLTGLKPLVRDPKELPPLFPSLADDNKNYKSNPEEAREKIRRNYWAKHTLMENHSLRPSSSDSYLGEW